VVRVRIRVRVGAMVRVRVRVGVKGVYALLGRRRSALEGGRHTPPSGSHETWVG